MMFYFFLVSLVAAKSNECEPIKIGEVDSVLCKCNATYCDDTTPFWSGSPGRVHVQTSSRNGKRIDQSEVEIEKVKSSKLKLRSSSISLDGPLKQEIIGFGGALTDSALISYHSLSRKTREKLENQWLNHFNIIRVPIGGTDFSTVGYSLDSLEMDFDLTRFNLSRIDFESRIPILRRWQEINKKTKIFGSAWSAPIWMKTNHAFNGITKLNGVPGDKVHKAWASYYLKYIEHMASMGINIWALTTQNEPSMGLLVSSHWNANGFTPRHMKEWLQKDLIPALNSLSYAAPKPKLLLLDDQRIFMPKLTDYLLKNEDIRENSDGVALHWYWNQFSNVNVLNDFHEKYPEKIILSSEACIGSLINDKSDIELGNPFGSVWHNGEQYAYDIIETLNHFTNGWVDWNLALDMTGGPNWAENKRAACIHVDGEKDEFYKTPCYYVMLHFSKIFIPGTRIISSSSPNKVLIGQRPNGDFVGVVQNLTPFESEYTFTKGENQFSLTLSGHSISSFIWQQ